MYFFFWLEFCTGFVFSSEHLTKWPNDTRVLHQSNAVVRSHPGPCFSIEDLVFFIRDLFTRLQIGGIELKNKSLESLLHLLDRDEKSASLVAEEGLTCWISTTTIRLKNTLRQRVGARLTKRPVQEVGLGPLLRILEIWSMPMKEKALAAVEAITADPETLGQS
jgi:hypothetical protein